MPDPPQVLGLIPARGGSKGLPGKNLAPLAGRPLIAHTIAAALASRHVSRVVVSTDDEAIARVAQEHGAQAPFLRPAELAGDATPALPVAQHALTWLEEHQGWRASHLVYLQPTSPLRRARHIDQALELLWQDDTDTVVSVVEVPHNFNPLSVMRVEGGLLLPYDPAGRNTLRRQDKPRLWARNGPAVLALTRQVVMEQNRLYGDRVRPLFMEPMDSVDIDGPFDLELAAWLLSRREGNGG